MRVRRSIRVLPVLLLVGCSSVSARGRILDPGGRPIENAVAAVRAGDSGPALESASSDQNGCFDVFIVSAPPGQQRFTLEIGAPGRKAVTLEFERSEREPLLVTLTVASDAGPGSVRVATPDEKSSAYDLYCIPVAVQGATSLGLR